MKRGARDPAFIEALRVDRSRGASELVRQALADLASYARSCPVETAEELEAELSRVAEELCRVRPSMAPVEKLVGTWRSALLGVAPGGLEAVREAASRAAEELIARSRSAVEAIGDATARLIAPGSSIITHSMSSTVLAVFRRLAGRAVRVIASESRPLCEGHALAAELSRLGIPATLVTDAQLGLFAGRADVALVGADAVLADGSVVNKAGTLLLALAAREASVPFWVCAESFKQSRLDPGSFPLEEMGASELGAPDLESVEVRNVYFDVTPPHLVDRWIDESSGGA